MKLSTLDKVITLPPTLVALYGFAISPAEYVVEACILLSKGMAIVVPLMLVAWLIDKIDEKRQWQKAMDSFESSEYDLPAGHLDYLDSIKGREITIDTNYKEVA